MDNTQDNLKFRAWDGKTMHYEVTIYQGRYIDCSGADDDIFFKWHDPSEQVAFMQFTGLYDCEGKEIYVSDILEYDDYDWFENKKIRKLAEVIFEDGMFVAEERTSLPAIYCLENIKVLGNLYEHPNLLNNE